jgi:O-antigen/teichoic acid export membrane protein
LGDPSSQGDLARTVVRGASLAGAGFILTQLIGLVSYMVIARLAPPSTFGKFAAASIIVGFTTFFVESGMSAALIQRRDRLEEAAATAVLATLAGGVGLSVLALVCAPLVGVFFRSHEIGIASAALSGVLFTNAVTIVPDALMQRRFSFVRRVVIDPLATLAYGLAAGVTLAVGMGIWGLVIATYAAGCVRVIAGWVFVGWTPDFRAASFRMWRELVLFGRHIVASEVLREVGNVGSTALVGRALGAGALGQFRYGQRLAIQVCTPLVQANAYVLFPAFARIAHDELRLRAGVLRATRLLVAIVFPVSLALIPLGTQIAVLLFGERWRESGVVLAALSGFVASFPVTQIAIEFFKVNRPNVLPRISGLYTITSLGLMVAFLPLGAAGVAGGISIASVAVASSALYIVVKILGFSVRELTGAIAPPALSGLGMVAILLVLDRVVFRFHPHTLLDRGALLASELAVGVVIYLAFLAVTGPHTLSELRELATFVVRRRVDLPTKNPVDSSTL